jgi:anti-sigma-K factor RskA
MTDAPLTPAEADEALAGEYVLGMLTLSERTAAAARAKTDPDFAARIAAWETRLEGLNDDFAPARAPDLMPAIEARLFPAPLRARRVWTGWLAGAATALALCALALVMLVPAPGPPPLTAILTPEGEGFVYEARFADDRLQVRRTAGTAAPAGQVHELWIIAPGAAPVSLGLLAEAGVDLAYPRPPAGWTLAVSLEPAGGSPTGAPTGPVLAAVELVEL